MPPLRPKILAIIILNAVLALLILVLLLNYFGIISLPGKKTVALAPCPDQLEGNHLLVALEDTDTGVVGTLHGKLEKTDFSPNGEQGVFDIVSLDEVQTYTFGAEEKEGLVYDGVGGGDGKLTNLAAGQTITVDFSCNPRTAQEGNLADFSVTFIEITGK